MSAVLEIEQNILKKKILIISLLLVILISGCVKETVTVKQPPVPRGILVNEITENMDITFTSIRYVLSDPACLDENYDLKNSFINMPDCNKKIYDRGELASPRQLFAMDLETGNVVQITNTDCFFITGQTVDFITVMAHAACSDTNDDGKINEEDKIELYLLDLITKKVKSLPAA